MKVLIDTTRGISYDEYHMFPIRDKQDGEATIKPDPNKLKLIFIMLDSVSHSTAKRYLNNTLKKMKASKSTIIMDVRILFLSFNQKIFCLILTQVFIV